MTWQGWAEIALTLGLAVAIGWPLGVFMSRVWNGERTWLDPVLRPVEALFYKACGVDPKKSQSWHGYALALLAFNLVGFLLRLRGAAPAGRAAAEPARLPGPVGHLSFNTAISFVTNTNWQSYAGETTMSTLSQMLVLTVQNFVSAATGATVAAALARAFVANRGEGVGNFWADLIRTTLYVLLPLSFVLAIVLVALGLPQTLAAGVTAHTLEGADQKISLYAVASQEAIKMLGINGGGIFNANSAHPFENPTPLTNLITAVSINVLGWAAFFAFGRMVLAKKDIRALVIAAFVLLFGRPRRAIYVDRDASRPGPGRRQGRCFGQHGRQGGPLRRAGHGRLGRHDHRRLERLGQRHAFQPDASGRRHRDVPDAAGRDPARRHRLGHRDHGRHGLAVGVRRRPDGRPHARISRQEDRGARDPALDPGRLVIPLSILGFSAIAAVLPEALKGLMHAGRTACRRSSTPTPRHGQQRLGLRGPDRQRAVVGHHPGHRHGDGPVPADRRRPGHRRLAGGQAQAGPSAGTLPTDGGLFVGLLIGVILILGGLQFFPAIGAGTDRRALPGARRGRGPDR
jgi:K+-transporting ATPase ATPase A chain